MGWPRRAELSRTRVWAEGSQGLQTQGTRGMDVNGRWSSERCDPDFNPLKTDRKIRLERVVTLQKRESKNRESRNAMSVALRVRAWI